jgi:hypothetical protein
MARGGSPGNKNAQKLMSEPELKQLAYIDYCEWVASGKSKDSWRWRKDDRLLCTFKTMERYMAESPTEFPAIKMEGAKCDSKAYWESVVADSATGKNKQANTASLQMLMRNKFGWDKHDQSIETNESHVQQIAKDIRSDTLSKAETCD